jgi:hypothetical protein
MFLDHFNVLMLKIILKKLKNIILKYFKIKNILKNNRNLKFWAVRDCNTVQYTMRNLITLISIMQKCTVEHII